MKKYFLIAMAILAAFGAFSCAKDDSYYDNRYDIRYASINHNHDDAYASVNHTHDEYAERNHTHNVNQTHLYTFNVPFSATTTSDPQTDITATLTKAIGSSDAVLVYGESPVWDGGYCAWPYSDGNALYMFSFAINNKTIVFSRFNKITSQASETISVRVVVVPANVVTSAKCAMIDINNYQAFINYLQLVGYNTEKEEILDFTI